MMKLLILLVSTLMSANAFAEIYPMFAVRQATIIIQGADQDAIHLFNAMNVQQEEIDQKIVKKIAHSTMYAEDVFDLVCTAAKNNLNNVSCTLKVFASQQSIVNTERKWFIVGVNDSFDARQVAQQFKHLGGQQAGNIFTSTDTKLRIYKTFDSQGEIVSFTIQFN